MKYIILGLATIVSAVLAAPAEVYFDIQQPGQNNVYHHGESVPLTWTHGTSSKAIVTVLKGDSNDNMVATNYQFEIPGGAKTKATSWKVPSTLSTAEKYNFEITYIGDSDQKEGKSYSNIFSIVDDAPKEQSVPTTMTPTANGDNGAGKKKNDGQTAVIGSPVQGNTMVAQGNPAVQNGPSVVSNQGRNAVTNAGAAAGYPAQSNKMVMAGNAGVSPQNQMDPRLVKKGYQ